VGVGASLLGLNAENPAIGSEKHEKDPPARPPHPSVVDGLTVRGALDGEIEHGRRVEFLKHAVEDSRWVKIDFSAGEERPVGLDGLRDARERPVLESVDLGQHPGTARAVIGRDLDEADHERYPARIGSDLEVLEIPPKSRHGLIDEIDPRQIGRFSSRPAGGYDCSRE